MGDTAEPRAAFGGSTHEVGRGRRPRRESGGVLVLILLIVGFYSIVMPGWLASDTSSAPVPLDPRWTWHYHVMVAHICCGLIAYSTVVILLWPGLRRRMPKLHRLTGRAYVFAGAIPAAALALILVVPAGRVQPVGDAGVVAWASLALYVTIRGYTAARDARYDDHRAWMLYSFALMFGVVSGRIWAVTVQALPGIGPDIVSVTHWQIEGYWLGWIGNVLLVRWWLRRSSHRADGTAARPDRASS